MSVPERALTFYQPWAWLVGFGLKPIENRPPGFSHKSFRGEFWIHAGVRPTDEAKETAQWELARECCLKYLGPGFTLPPPENMDYGSIIGRARIIDILSPRGTLLFKPHVPVVPRVKCRGYQGFWRVPAPVLERLAA